MSVYRVAVRIGCHENDEWEDDNRVLLRSDSFEVMQWQYMLDNFQPQISEQILREINSPVADYGGGNWGPWWWLPGRQIKFSHWIPVRISVSGKHSFPLHVSTEVWWGQGYASRLMNGTGGAAKGGLGGHNRLLFTPGVMAAATSSVYTSTWEALSTCIRNGRSLGRGSCTPSARAEADSKAAVSLQQLDWTLESI